MASNLRETPRSLPTMVSRNLKSPGAHSAPPCPYSVSLALCTCPILLRSSLTRLPEPFLVQD
eukprot:504255-Rhodomonas_salina.3